MWEAVQMPAVYCTLLFFLCRGIFIPNLDEATYFYSQNVSKIGRDTYEMLELGQSCAMFVLIVVYYNFLAGVSLKYLVFAALLVELMLTVLFLLVTKGVTEMWRWDDAVVFGFIIILQKPVYVAFALLPTLAQMTYLVPDGVEASMGALLLMCLNFTYDWGGRLIALGVYGMFGITHDNLDDTFRAVELKLAMVILYMCFVTYLPTKQELREAISKQNTTFITRSRCRSDVKQPEPDSFDDETYAPMPSSHFSSAFGSALASEIERKIPQQPTLYQGRTGYTMNSIYADGEMNGKIQALMEAMDDARRFVSPENSKGSGPWSLTVEPTEQLNFWAWNKATDNASRLVNYCVYYFPGMSHDKLFELMTFEAREKWDPETKFNVIESND